MEEFKKTEEERLLDEERVMLEADRSATISRREYIEADPARYAQERVDQIAERLAIRQPRRATIPGHISMYDHLSNLKKEYEDCVKAKSLTGIVADEVQKLSAAETACTAKLADIDAEIAKVR